jgi:prepilin-type N-terminal cleavage/methylation domain-containing protein
MRNVQSGFSLIEVVFVLALLGVLAGIAVPAAAALRDVLAVRAARDALAARLAHTRALAVTHGGARLELDIETARVRVLAASGDTIGDPLHIGDVHGVVVTVPGRTGTIALRYDGLGIGRLANRTVVLRRGNAEARLVVTAYGRWRSE